MTVAESLLTFGPFELCPARRWLVRDGKAVRLGSRALDLLILLAERAGEIVRKEEVIERVWPDTFVEETNLRVHIATLRKVLGDGGAGERFITTVSGRGYCFVARVARTEAADDTALPGPVEAAHNLPAALTRTIGRGAAVDQIAAQLARRRFVTVIGPAGIGKTTVALAVAGNLVGRYADRVCFADLAPIADHRLVPGTVASALGVVLRPDDPLPALLDHLRSKSMLLVLDNCEHVIESMAPLAEGILRGAPGVHLLATSREPFRAAGEWLYRLGALAVPPPGTPPTPAEALGYPAVELFAERATAAWDAFALTAENVATVCDICRRLDGIPLAIELAAARIDLGLEAFSAHLGDRFALLTGGRRTALPRHRTLRAAFDWSHDMLSAAEQLAFRRLAPMAGAFGMEAAIAVVAGAAIPAVDVPELLAGLIDKSLVATDVGGRAIRYRLLESTRAYAAEKLAQSSDAGPTARRYAMHVRDLMRRGEADWKAQPGPDWLATYGAAIDDVRAAIDWALGQAGDLAIGLDLTAASAMLWFQLSLMGEYRERVERALRRQAAAGASDPALEMRLQAALGHTLWYGSIAPDLMEAAFARALALAEDLGDTVVQLQALWGMWAVRRGRGEYRTALGLASRYEAVARTIGDAPSVLLADRILSLTHHFLGNQAEASRRAEAVLAQARRATRAPNTDFQLDPNVAMPTLLCRIRWVQGFPDQARAAAQAAIAAAEQADHWFSICYTLYNASWPLAVWTGDLDEAERWLDLAANRSGGNPYVEKWATCATHLLRLQRGGEAERLTAAYYAPRLDISTLSEMTERLAAATVPVPQPGPEPEDALWSLAEVLRVDADLLLWHGGPDAEAAAETRLRRSLDVARAQGALSWELRGATSLATLWHRLGRTREARDLLAAVSDRVTEGFGTGDVVAARRLLAEWR